MGKSCVLSLLTVTIMLALVGLLALTSESVHHDPVRALSGTSRLEVTQQVSPETGATFERDGLMLTY